MGFYFLTRPYCYQYITVRYFRITLRSSPYNGHSFVDAFLRINVRRRCDRRSGSVGVHRKVSSERFRGGALAPLVLSRTRSEDQGPGCGGPTDLHPIHRSPGRLS